MNWQNVTVYAVLALCVLFAAYGLWKPLTKKQTDKCADCSCGCNRGKKSC